jgi:hypothetical protein
MQYHIINRFFPCNSILGIWYKDHKSDCDFCNKKEDDIQHYFYECDISKTFWKHFSTWWYNATAVNLNIKALDVIFGIMNPFKDSVIDCLNYCILLGKAFIVKQKKTTGDCFLYFYQRELKNRLELEQFICMDEAQEDKFNRKWGFIYENL